jgi:hypothetical protein
MEWKEHIAWLSPILATTVAFIVVYYGTQLIRHNRVRRTAIGLYVAQMRRLRTQEGRVD